MNRLPLVMLLWIIGLLVACAGSPPPPPAIMEPTPILDQTEAIGESPELGVELLMELESTTIGSVGEELRVRLEARNVSDVPVTLHLNNGQTFDLIVSNARGEEVTRWSNGRIFTMALQALPLRPGESIVQNLLLPVPEQPGIYRVVGTLMTAPMVRTEPLAFEYRPEAD
ncbi:hypothetical protein KQI84_11980 [bacterium]|nr:hypothetical protein [bacterium]